MKPVTTSQMRELERRTIEEAGLKGEELMDRAGEGVAALVKRISDITGYQTPLVHLIAGRGNNGGDAFAAARFLRDMGLEVEVWLAGSHDQVQGDALLHLSKLKQAKIKVHDLPTLEDWQAARTRPFLAEIIVDGVLGTGLSGPARGPAAGAIQYINSQAAESLIVSIDVPSGLNADTGQAEGDVVLADATVTLGLPKRGLLETSALEAVGVLEVVDIGIPAEFVADAQGEADCELIHASDLRALFPRRRRTSHKGTYGHVLLIGGSHGLMGAMALASRAALRSGAGLVTVLVPVSIAGPLATMTPEVMVHAGRETEDGTLDPAVWADWRERVDTFDAILVGPGLGRHQPLLGLLRNLIRECNAPLVLDADALTLLAGQPDYLSKARKPCVITPHPGEMAALLHRDVEQVQAHRAAAAAQAADSTRGVVVLKGAGTIVAQFGRPVHINLTGNPGLATGGTGDVLAGMITALLGQGLSAFDAARAGVFLHGRAGDLAAWRKSQTSLLASDLIEELPFAFRDVSLR
jgi:NAD(P)H-hydrate epimerase